MRRGAMLLLLMFATVARAAEPTCQELSRVVPASFERASEVLLAVSVMQGRTELAFEASHLKRNAEGLFDSTTVERRGWQRPEGTRGGGATPGETFSFSCDRYELIVLSDSEVELRVFDDDPDAFVDQWTLRFVQSPHGWLPKSISAPFEVRVLLIPVRGRFITEFSDWVFVSNSER